MASVKQISQLPQEALPGVSIPRGYGALKGLYTVLPGIDLTQPIYEQAAKLKSSAKKAGRKPQTK